VDRQVVNKLLELNREFYSKFSAEFSDSRSEDRLNLDPWREYLRDEMSLLDVGCGNGRLVSALEREKHPLAYLGIDSSAELVALAAKRAAKLKHLDATFRVADLADPNWCKGLGKFGSFDLMLALAVLHHLPSFQLRARVLNDIKTLLAPNGAFVMSNWQFLNSQRLRNKLVPWDRVDLKPEELEQGDYLLDWKRGGTGYRYVHFVTEAEVQELARTTRYTVVRQEYADNDLNLFSILKPA